jgi:Rad3-related DNA helicase
VARTLLIQLSPETKWAGTVRLLADAKFSDFAFSSCDELIQHLGDCRETVAVIAGAGHPRATRELRLSWLGEPTAVWDAADLAYTFSVPLPASLDELQALSHAVTERLESIGDDLLAQIVLLIQEQAAEGSLGWFSHELYRRHDALSIPRPGAVDMDRFYPPEREAGAPSRQDVPEDLLERVLDARTQLASAFEQYEDRPQQMDMLRAVEEALANSRPLAIEAGTGVGKSLAYLLPLAVHAVTGGHLCLVSTNTINLQQQLVEHDIPRLRAILDSLELKVTLLKGRDHYLCLKRLKETWLNANPAQRQRSASGSAQSIAAIKFIIRLLLDYDAGAIPDMDSVPSSPYLRMVERHHLLHGIDCRFQTCLGDRCDLKAQCHFFHVRAEAQQSHLVVTNHALVFSLFNPSDSAADNVVTRAQAIVFDEAHNLEAVITDQHTLEVTHLMPVDFGNRLLGLLQEDAVRRRLELAPAQIKDTWQDSLREAQAAAAEVPSWIKLAVEVRTQVDQLLLQATEKGHLQYAGQSQLTPPTALPGQRHVLDLLGKLALRMHAVLERMRRLATVLASMFADEESSLYIDDDMLQIELKALHFDLIDCTIALSNWRPEDPGAITWFNSCMDEGEAQWSYKTAPLRAGPVFQALLASKECTVLCGATLTVAGRFDFLQASLGFTPEAVGHTVWRLLDSPFDHANRSLLLIATDLAGPTGSSRDEYLAQLEQVTAGVCETFKRGVLILFNSYRDLNHLAERLAFHIDEERILVQGVTGSRAELSERFKRDGDKVLLATRSFWEGFDVTGEALSCVVLAKLPFANFKDPIHAGRQRAIDAEGGDSFMRYSLPLAAMQFKQGFGRLIRTKTDYGCVFLLDSRVARAAYGKVFVDSLPNPKIISGTYTDCLATAREFMDQMQPKASAGGTDG